MLKDPAEAAAYLEAVIEDDDQAALMLALRQVAQARGGIAEIARRAKLTREATAAANRKLGVGFPRCSANAAKPRVCGA